MRFLLFISFIVLLACNNHVEKKQENPKSVLTLLSEDISNTPNNPALFVKRAEYFLSENNLESALMDYKECVKLSPENGGYHYEVAYLYYEIAKLDRTKQQYPEKALMHLEKTIALHTDTIPALLLKGELHLAFNEVKGAIDCLNQVIELDYNIPKAHLLKGYIYSALGEEDRAIQFFHNAVTINPAQEDAYVQLGLIYQEKKIP